MTWYFLRKAWQPRVSYRMQIWYDGELRRRPGRQAGVIITHCGRFYEDREREGEGC